MRCLQDATASLANLGLDDDALERPAALRDNEPLRVALSVASVLGERTSLLRGRLARSRAARQDVLDLQARFDSERSAVSQQLRQVDSSAWWTEACVAEIAQTFETACAWRDHNGAATVAHQTMRREILGRYGIAIERPAASPDALWLAIRNATLHRASAHAASVERGIPPTAGEILIASSLPLEGA